jgi:hypothetical protein
MRLALHYGTLIEGPLGPAGDAPIVVSRLLDATPVREYLNEHPERDLALVISDSLYENVVCSGLCVLDPATFVKLEVEIKQILYRGYLHHRDAVRVVASP